MTTLIDFRDMKDPWGDKSKAEILPDGSVDGSELLRVSEEAAFAKAQERFEKYAKEMTKGVDFVRIEP